MYPKKYNLYKKKRNYTKLVISVIIIILFLLLAFFIIDNFNNSIRKSIVGKWQSETTKEIVTFTDDQKVKLSSNSLTGTYHIISPNVMEYTISDMSFEMIYRLDNNKLYWGTDKFNLEVFIPK